MIKEQMLTLMVNPMLKPNRQLLRPREKRVQLFSTLAKTKANLLAIQNNFPP